MSIRCVYAEEPNFPATDQHPDAERVAIGGYWVDYIGPAPSQQDVADFLDPPEEVARREREASFKSDPARVDMLARLKTATPAQIDAYIEANVTNLAQARTFLKALTKVLALVARG